MEHTGLMLADVLAAALLLASLLAVCQTLLASMIRSVLSSVRSHACFLQMLDLQSLVAHLSYTCRHLKSR